MQSRSLASQRLHRSNFGCFCPFLNRRGLVLEPSQAPPARLKPSRQMPYPVAIRLLRSFSAAFAERFQQRRASSGVWQRAGHWTVLRWAGRREAIWGRLNTSRCETCGQAEHLNVRRSNATSDAGSPRWSTCIRRISAPQAKQSMAVLCPKILRAWSAARFRSVKLLSDPCLLDGPHPLRDHHPWARGTPHAERPG